MNQQEDRQVGHSGLAKFSRTLREPQDDQDERESDYIRNWVNGNDEEYDQPVGCECRSIISNAEESIGNPELDG